MVSKQPARRRVFVSSCLAAAGVLAAATLPARAEGEASRFSLELNRLAPSKGGCLVTFVARNGLPAALESSSFEIVLFDTEGLVDRMTVFDFGALPAGKTVVRQFQVAGLACDGIGRLLVNDAKACSGAGVEPGACIAALTTASKAGVPFGS